jgi:hypothetical protein
LCTWRACCNIKALVLKMKTDLKREIDVPPKRMQPDQNVRYALILTADARRYVS